MIKNTESSPRFFNTSKGKYKLEPDEVYYVESDKPDHRNKNAVLKGGQKIKLMNYAFDELLDYFTDLRQATISILVAKSLIISVNGRLLGIDNRKIKSIPTELECGGEFVNNFKIKLLIN